MLTRTERIKNNNPEHHRKLFAESKETIDEMLEKLGVIKVKSYPCTPEHKPQPKPQSPLKK